MARSQKMKSKRKKIRKTKIIIQRKLMRQKIIQSTNKSNAGLLERLVKYGNHIVNVFIKKERKSMLKIKGTKSRDIIRDRAETKNSYGNIMTNFMPINLKT